MSKASVKVWHSPTDAFILAWSYHVYPGIPPTSTALHPRDSHPKVRAAEDGWNSRDPLKVSLAYTPDSQWRNRSEFPCGRAQIVEFLTRKWAMEKEYRLIK